MKKWPANAGFSFFISKLSIVMEPEITNTTGDAPTDPMSPEEMGEVIETAPGLPPTLVTKNVKDSWPLEAEKLVPYLDKETAARDNRVELLQRQVRAYESDVRSYLASIEDYKGYVKERKLAAKKAALAAKKEAARVIPPVDTTKVIERLQRHKAIQYVKVGTSSLSIFLKPLWVNAQVRDDSKERTRTFIGCYRIELVAGGLDIRITNLTFPDWYPHWSVEVDSKRPCWGDWKVQVEELWKAGKLVELTTLLVAYLTSLEDGSAYVRTWNFRMKRVLQITVDGAKERSDDPLSQWHHGRCFIHGGRSTDKSDIEMHALPARANRNRGSAHFLAPVNCDSHYDHSDGLQRRDWYVDSPFYWLSPEQETQLVILIDSLKSETREAQREKLREWGEHVIATYPEYVDDAGKRRVDLLAALDTATDLNYKTVAQPLVIDTKLCS